MDYTVTEVAESHDSDVSIAVIKTAAVSFFSRLILCVTSCAANRAYPEPDESSP
jgi:hypothetical protein